MNTTRTHRSRAALGAVAAAVIALSACSRHDADTAAPSAVASAPTSVAMAPDPTMAPAPAPSVAPAPTPSVATTRAPIVVAQNESTYEQGRRDQQRHDDRLAREARPLPPRADRDADVPPPLSAHQREQEAWREHQQVASAGCPNCGVVESIDAVKVQGQTNGTGAVAGGVGGAVIGNRIAGGGNRTLGGIVGAVGGGLIGNAIEKHERTATVYDIHVRMSDGSMRTVRQSTSPAVGEKVLVEADGLHERT